MIFDFNILAGNFGLPAGKAFWVAKSASILYDKLMDRKKILQRLILTTTTVASLLFITSTPVIAQWLQDDLGIRTINQDNVPQFNSHGTIQYSYTNDSFFPRALYAVDIGPQFANDTFFKRDTLPELHQGGFNTFMSPCCPSQSLDDEARTLGLKIIYDIGWQSLAAANNINGWSLDYLKNWILNYKNYNSILMWDLFDEQPNFFPDQPMDNQKWRQVYDAIKSADPVRSVFANGAGVPVCEYEQGQWDYISDVLNLDSYYISSTTQPVYMTDILNWLNCPFKPGRSGKKKPLSIILQAFSGPGGGGVMPAPSELRAMIYSSVVNGATGYWLFLQKNQPYQFAPGVSNGINPQDTPDQWAAASQTNHEIEAYKRAILSKTSPDEYHVFYDRDGTRLETILKNTGDNDGVRYLLVVNSAAKGFSAKFQFTNNINKVTSVLDGKDVNMYDVKSFGNYFVDYMVKIYKIEFSGVPLAGDLNNDGKVNSVDFGLFMNDFGKTNYQGVADLNNDGKVDIFDYNILVSNYGKHQQ